MLGQDNNLCHLNRKIMVLFNLPLLEHAQQKYKSKHLYRYLLALIRTGHLDKRQHPMKHYHCPGILYITN